MSELHIKSVANKITGGRSWPSVFMVCVRFILVLLSTFLGLLAVTFVIGRVMPLDPVLAIVGEQATQETYLKVYHELGLDKSIFEQFFNYIWSVLHGDFGESLLTRRPVIDDLARVFPATFELATLSIFIGIFVGVPMGVLAAKYKGRWQDQLIRFVGLFGYSMPIFWLAIMGMFIFYGTLGWVAGPGRLDIFYNHVVPTYTGLLLIDSIIAGNSEVFFNAVSHLVTPVFLLGYFSLAYISRMTRSFMLEQLHQEYITTARVKGVSEFKVVWRHALGNIMVPLLTVVVLSYAHLLEGSVLTEIIFNWPGMGSYITTALLRADMNGVMGGTVVIGIIFVSLNQLSDLLYRLLDPRAK